MSHIARIGLGFLIAPVAAAVAVTLVVAPFQHDPMPLPGFPIAVTVVAYVVALVFGVPAFLMTRAWHVRSYVAYSAVGASIGLLAAALFWFLVADPVLAGATVIGGLAATSVFWLITARESNNSLERTRER